MVGAAEEGGGVAVQPVGGFAAEMRGGEGNAAAAYQFGVVGGETAQHEAAEAVADEVQRFLVLLVVAADGFGEAAAVLGQNLGDAVVAEAAAVDIVAAQLPGKREHHPCVHMDTVQQEGAQRGLGLAHGVSGCRRQAAISGLRRHR